MDVWPATEQMTLFRIFVIFAWSLNWLDHQYFEVPSQLHALKS